MSTHSSPAERPGSSRRPPDDYLAAAGTGPRARRARTEPMRLRELRDGRVVVDTDGGTYVVDSDHEQCTCPDHAIRGVRCKHLRRVAIEVTAGTVPPAGTRQSVCAVCGRQWVVDADQPTALCETHAFDPGELVVDRETGKLLVVVAQTTTRADQRRIDDGRRIADVASNRNYGSHEPVIEAIYVGALGRPTRRYSFPASRLRKTDDGLARGQRLLASQTAEPAIAAK